VAGSHIKSGEALQSCMVLVFKPDDVHAPIQIKFRFSDQKLNEINDFFAGIYETYGSDFTLGYDVPLSEGQVEDKIWYENQVASYKINRKKSHQVTILPDLSEVKEVAMENKRGKVIARCLF